MLEEVPKGIRKKVVESIKKLVVETQLKRLDLPESSFEGSKNIPLKDEPGTAHDLLVSPRGLAMMQRLATLHNKTTRKALGRQTEKSGQYGALYDVEKFITKNPIREHLNSNWLSTIEELARTKESTKFQAGDIIDTFLTRAETQGRMEPAEIRWFADTLRGAYNKIDNAKGPYQKMDVWRGCTLREISASSELNPDIPEHVARALLRFIKSEDSWGSMESMSLAAVALNTAATRQSTKPTETTLTIAKEVKEIGNKNGFASWDWEPIARAALNSSWSYQKFNGDPQLLFPPQVFEALSKIPRKELTSVASLLPTFMDDRLVGQPFDPERFHEIIERSQKMSRITGGAFGVRPALRALGKITPLDGEEISSFITKHVGTARTKWRALGELNQAPDYMIPALSYFFHRKPKSLVSVAENMKVARTFDIKVSKAFRSLLIPFESLKPEQQEKLITPDENGRVRVVDLYAKMIASRLRSEDTETDSMGPIVEKSKETLQKKTDRLRLARDPAVRASLIKEISLQLANETFEFFDRRLDSTIRNRAEKMFGTAVTKEHMQHPAFIDGLAMTMKAGKDFHHKNETIACELLSHFLSGKTRSAGKSSGYPIDRPENQKWLTKNLQPAARKIWLGDMRTEYPVSEGQALAENMQDRIKNFLEVARQIAAEVPATQRPSEESLSSPDGLDQWFVTLNAREYGNAEWYRDMKIQVDGLRQTRRSAVKGGRMPSKIVLYKEQDPMRALMMGTWVNGSCLDASAINSWSAFTNATEVNKGVIYITDERDTLLGRVLIAVDKKNRLVRFPTYYTSAGLDLNPFVNRYLKEQASHLGVSTKNGDGDKVELLFSDDWYKDPAVAIQ